MSGGEKGRVSLAKLMLSEANFLILDEPTNHLDIASKEILEEALNNYSGTVLYVSHDRYFINSTASRILELVNQTFVNYIGNYDYYLEKKEELTRAYASAVLPILLLPAETLLLLLLLCRTPPALPLQVPSSAGRNRKSSRQKNANEKMISRRPRKRSAA